MTPGLADRRVVFPLAAVAVLIVLRGVLSAFLPLSFDEAYYWMWSKHLAWGYYDHPPMVAFMIRAGTMLFGDTSFGVRAGALLLSAAGSWAVWRDRKSTRLNSSH